MLSFQFIFTVAVLVLIIFMLVMLIWLAARMEASDQLIVPKRKRIKPSKRPLSARLGDFWAYWRAGMSLRNAWQRAGRVI